MIVHQVVMVKSEKQIEKHVKTNKNDLTTSQVVRFIKLWITLLF